MEELTTIHTQLGELNHAPTLEAQAAPRTSLLAAMDQIAPQQRSPLALDLVLDCDLQLPESVASDMAVAAGLLTRLGREPLGPAAWADYHRRFVERYGVGSVVPLRDVLDDASGLGYPAGYPGSVLPAPAPSVTDRDRRLLALAWEALADGGRLELTDALIGHVTAGDLFDPRFLQPHAEIAAKIYARSVEALNAGDYLLAVTPARATGTLTARFQSSTRDAAMVRAYRSVPALHEGATAVQLSCPSRFVRGQNVARLPRFLPEVLALGEPPSQGPRGLRPADLALTATGRGQLLIEAATGRIIDPQVFHALALDRQMPLLARFLAHLPRAFAASLTAFEFGPAAGTLPHLPKVRYGRIILAPERWRLHTADKDASMTTATPGTAAELHADMVQKITDSRPGLGERVVHALRAVPRHLFLPGATIDEAYNPYKAVITKTAPDGTHLSCASVATLVAGMLDELRVRPGDRVFEVGAGTGYNAALLAELTGPDGLVVTADINEVVTAEASAALAAGGLPQRAGPDPRRRAR